MTTEMDVVDAQRQARLLPLVVVSLLGQIPNMEIAFSNALTISAVDYYAQPNVTAISRPLSLEQLSWFAALPDAFIFVGTLLGSVAIDPMGRRNALVLGTLILLLAWTLLQVSQEYPYLLANRAFSGLATGIIFPSTVSYVTDISLVRSRGVLGNLCITVNSGSWMVSPLLTALFGFQASLWIMTMPTMIFLIVAFFLPESPAWLVKRGSALRAEQALSRIRGEQYDLGPEMKELAVIAHNNMDKEESKEEQNDNVRSTCMRLSSLQMPPGTSRHLLRPLSIMCLLIAGQACMGLDLISTYSLEIADRVQMPMDKYLFVILMQANMSVGYGLSTLLAARLGRRRHFISTSLLLTLTWIATFILYRPKEMCDDSVSTTVSSFGFPITLLVSSLLYGLGVGPVLFTMCGEIFLPRFKGAGSGIVFGVRQILLFTLIKLYPEMLSVMGFRMILLFHAVWGAATTLFAFLILPETHGLTLRQIASLFQNMKDKNANNDTFEKV